MCIACLAVRIAAVQLLSRDAVEGPARQELPKYKRERTPYLCSFVLAAQAFQALYIQTSNSMRRWASDCYG